MSSKQAPLESAWQTLRSSLEWSQGFSLIFVFCSDAASKKALFGRASDLMQAQVRPFQQPQCKSADAVLKRLLPLAVNPSQAHVAMGLPLWLDIDSSPGDPAWDQARQEFLYRLNERRAAIMREHPRPVVLALPLNWTKRAAEAAPDLWTIRQPTVYLDGRPSDAGDSGPDIRDFAPVSVRHSVEIDSKQIAELPAVLQRWLARSEQEQAAASIWDASLAIDAALEHGQAALAHDMSQKAAEQARVQLEKSRNPERLRDLSVSMNKLGQVAQALGRLEEAQHAFEMEIQIAQELCASYGETATALEVLAYGHEALGDVLKQTNQGTPANEHHSKARLLYQRLALAMPHEKGYASALKALQT